MFGSKGPSIILPPTEGCGKSLIFLLLLVLLGAVVLGVVLGGGDMLSQGAKIEEAREVQQSKDLTLIIWILLAFIFGLITGVMLSTPRLPGW